MIFMQVERNLIEVYTVGATQKIRSILPCQSALLVVCPIFIQQRGWMFTLIGSKHLRFTRDVVHEISKIP